MSEAPEEPGPSFTELEGAAKVLAEQYQIVGYQGRGNTA